MTSEPLVDVSGFPC